MDYIEKELSTKLKEYLDGKLSPNEFHEWAMEQIYENREEKVQTENKELVKDLFGDLVAMLEASWSTWTMEKAHYYYVCLIGREKYNLDKANSFNKKIDIPLD
jgi:hypothetical protein